MKSVIGTVGALFLNWHGGGTAAPAEPTPSETPKVTVLAIDDDPAMLDVLRPLLKGEGYNVLTAQSGTKGLDMLRFAKRDIRVVVLDYNMPRLNGGETLQYLRKLAPGVKVVGLTGIKPELLPESYRETVDRLVLKPYRSSELLTSIRELLGIRAPA
jgi:CheY-like chemotaxis protein